MKKFLFLPFSLLFIYGCSKSSNDRPALSESLQGNWQITNDSDITQCSGNTYHVDSVFKNGPIAEFTTNAFSITNMENGTYNPSDGTLTIYENSISQTYNGTYTVSGNTLTFIITAPPYSGCGGTETQIFIRQ